MGPMDPRPHPPERYLPPSQRRPHQRSSRWGVTIALGFMAFAMVLVALATGRWEHWLSVVLFALGAAAGWWAFPFDVEGIAPPMAEDERGTAGVMRPRADDPLSRLPARTNILPGIATLVLTIGAFATLALGAG